MSYDSPSEPPIAPTTRSNCLRTAGITCLVLVVAGAALGLWFVNMMTKNPAVRQAYKGARLIADCQVNLEQIGGALERYSRRNEKYPSSLAELHPNFLENKAALHCPADRRPLEVISYDYDPPSPKDSPDTPVIECKRHVVVEGQPPWTLTLQKDGRVIKQGYIPREPPR